MWVKEVKGVKKVRVIKEVNRGKRIKGVKVTAHNWGPRELREVR